MFFFGSDDDSKKDKNEQLDPETESGDGPFEETKPETEADQDKPVEKSTELADDFVEVEEGFRDKYLRVNADFENFRKRVERDKMYWMQLARSEVILKLLDVVDDFDRALGECEKSLDGVDRPWLSGFEMVAKKMDQMLADLGVVEIDCSGQFDPLKHEAVSKVVSAEHESGAIVEVYQRGFLLNGNLLRPAKVSVAE